METEQASYGQWRQTIVVYQQKQTKKESKVVTDNPSYFQAEAQDAGDDYIIGVLWVSYRKSNRKERNMFDDRNYIVKHFDGVCLRYWPKGKEDDECRWGYLVDVLPLGDHEYLIGFDENYSTKEEATYIEYYFLSDIKIARSASDQEDTKKDKEDFRW